MIDEKKLIEELDKKYIQIPLVEENRDMFYHNSGYNCAIGNAIILAKKQPKVDKWIPVSERLPEKDGWYLVQYKRELLGGLQIEVVGYDERGFLGSIDEVIAWQPLPEPYKEQSEVIE